MSQSQFVIIFLVFFISFTEKLYFWTNSISCNIQDISFIMLFLLQKIFVMPNMDDVWLPIMHSAMDTRSNANLVTVTNDALKDPEPLESEVSDIWRLLFTVYTDVTIWTLDNDGHFITVAIWLVPTHISNYRCSNGQTPHPLAFYPHRSTCSTSLWPHMKLILETML